jgi:hypothetical protein
VDSFGAAQRTTEKAAEQDTGCLYETRRDAPDFIVISNDVDNGSDWII